MSPTGKGRLRIAIEDFFETFDVTEIIWKPFKTIVERLEDEAIELYDDVARESGMEKILPAWIRQGSITSRTNKRPIQLAPIIVGIIMMLIGAIIGALQPAQRLGSYKVDELLKSYRPSPVETWMLARRGEINDNQLVKILSELGVPDELSHGLRELSRNYLTLSDYVIAYRRGKITIETLREKSSAIGVEKDDLEKFLDITEVIPTPNDLIYMAVREAFNDEFSSRFNHDEDFPPEFGEWAKKQGLSEEWSKRYWRAHWQLPSPQQVFEMLHRLRPGVSEVTLQGGDVDSYLKAADYSPFWRERLKKISYNPYTRVDVRRMYKTGVLTEAQVKEAYLDLGYDNDHAQALTQFTIAYEAEEETGIVRSSVLDAYGNGMIDRSKAESMLTAGGYDATTVAFYLDNVDFKEGLEIQQIKLANIKKRFVEGLIDETTVNNEINTLGLPAERTDAILQLWLTERENQVALPTLAQIETFYELGIVTLDDYRRILKRRGYADETIDWNIKRIDIEKSTKAQNEAEKAEADNERLQKSKTASSYQKQKAEIDLSIAQAKAEATDIDVALHNDLREEDIATLQARKDEIKLFIAQMNVAKAQLRFDTQTELDKLV